MAKFSALFLSTLAVVLTASHAIRYLTCNRSNNGDIFVRSGMSVYRCADRREVFVGCLFSKSNADDTVYGFGLEHLKNKFSSARNNIFNVGRNRNLPNCCVLRNSTYASNVFGAVQSSISDMVELSKNETELPFREGVTGYTMLAQLASTAPLQGICKADPGKKIYTNYESDLWKCNGDVLQKTNACAFFTNGTSAIRCGDKTELKTALETELGIDAPDVTAAKFCCEISSLVESEDNTEIMMPHLKTCNTI